MTLSASVFQAKFDIPQVLFYGPVLVKRRSRNERSVANLIAIMSDQNNLQKQWLATFVKNKRLRRRFLLTVAAILNLDRGKKNRDDLATAISKTILNSEKIEPQKILSLPGARYLAISETLRSYGMIPERDKEKMINQVLSLGFVRPGKDNSPSRIENSGISEASRDARGEQLIDTLIDSLK